MVHKFVPTTIPATAAVAAMSVIQANTALLVHVSSQPTPDQPAMESSCIHTTIPATAVDAAMSVVRANTAKQAFVQRNCPRQAQKPTAMAKPFIPTMIPATAVDAA